MIIIKRDGAIYFCESKCNAHRAATKADFTKHPENLHVIRDMKNPKKLILSDSPRRVADIIRYKDIFPKKLTPQYLVNTTYPALLAALEPFGLLRDGTFDFNFAFASGDKCYILRQGGVIDAVEEFFPFCYARETAISAYMRYKDEPIYKLIGKIYAAIEELSGEVQFPIAVMNTKSTELKIIEGEEMD